MNVIGEQRHLVPLARRCYEEGKLNEIMDLDLKDSESVKEFSEVAYQCLHDDQERRPSMDVVLQKLEKVLELLEYEEACELQKLEETLQLQIYEEALELQKLEEALRLQEYEEACELRLLEEALGLQKLVETLQLLEFDDALEMQELMEALELYKLGDMLNLEMDYAAIKVIHMMTTTRPTYTTKEEIYTHISSGILIDDDKVWFSIDENGKNQEMISAMKFMPLDPKQCEMISCRSLWHHPTSVFSMVAKILDASKVNVQVSIRAQFLSFNVSYAAYLVCKHESDKSKYSAGEMKLRGLKYKLNNQSQSYISHPRYYYDSEWMMIELFQTNNLKRSVEFNVILEEFHFPSFCKDEVIVQGIEFLPIQKFDDDKMKKEEIGNLPTCETGWESLLPSDYEQFVYYSGKKLEKQSQNYVITETKDEAYALLSRGVYITVKDDIHVWFWITKSKAKKCFMLSPESIISRYYGDGHKLEVSYQNQSRFKYVLEIQSSPRVYIHFTITSSLLSANTSYACYLVYKIPQAFHNPVDVSTHRTILGLAQHDGEPGAFYHDGYFYLSRYQSPVVIGLDGAEGEGTPSTISNKLLIRELPRKREDGWLELRLWKFTTHDDPSIQKSCPMWFSSESKDAWSKFPTFHADYDHHFSIWLTSTYCIRHDVKIPKLSVQGVEFRPI
ncbi:hypothetical protein L1887_28396 [Cichorium endivia]|nr:hypothetical protein L1887_28396 [Cichorium endivia]